MDKLIIGITGSKGFLGKYFSQYLINKPNLQVIEFSSKLNIDHPNYFSIGKNINISTLKKIKVLIHCAHDFKNKDENFQAMGIELIYKQIKKLNLNIKIIYISSIAAFDKAQSLYGKSKYLSETIVYRNKGIIVKPGIIYGDKNLNGLVNKITNFTKKSMFAPYFSNLNSKIYLTHIDDLCESISLIIDNEQQGVYFCANKEPISFKELIIKFSIKQNLFLIPIKWQLLFYALKITEYLNIKVSFRSDSILSLAKQNPNPLDKANLYYTKLFRCN